MFSSLRVKGILSQTVHAAYPIVCFPVLVRTFFTEPKLIRIAVKLVFFTGLFKNVNVQSVADKEKEKRDKMKEENEQKKQQIKDAKEKQKQKAEERKEKEKKRTQKGERRR